MLKKIFAGLALAAALMTAPMMVGMGVHASEVEVTENAAPVEETVEEAEAPAEAAPAEEADSAEVFTEEETEVPAEAPAVENAPAAVEDEALAEEALAEEVVDETEAPADETEIEAPAAETEVEAPAAETEASAEDATLTENEAPTLVVDNEDGTRTVFTITQHTFVDSNGDTVTVRTTNAAIEVLDDNGNPIPGKTQVAEPHVEEISRIPQPTPEPTPEPVIDEPTPEPTPEPVIDEPTPEPTPEPVIDEPEQPVVVVTVEKPVEEQVITVAAPAAPMIVRGQTGSTRAPQTGDESNVMLYLCMMMLSAAGLIVCGRKVRA